MLMTPEPAVRTVTPMISSVLAQPVSPGPGVVRDQSWFRRSRWSAVVATLAIVAAGCGSGSDDEASATTDASPATTEAPAETPATTAAPATTQAPAATAAPATTAPAPATTVDPLAAVRTQAEALVGPYTGAWTNTTFGSTGPMAMDIALDGDELVVEIDLGGFVFGQSDPEPESYRIPLSSITGSGAFDTAVFGAMTVNIDGTDGTITMLADAVPAPGIASLEASVTPTADGAFEGTYVVVFDGGDTADGTMSFARG